MLSSAAAANRGSLCIILTHSAFKEKNLND
jgi:hypothetical protein